MRSPFLEIDCMVQDPEALKGMAGDTPPEALRHLTDPIGFAKDMKSPRVIKSHMPLEFLPPKLLDTCKGVLERKKCLFALYYYIHTIFSVVYVCRNVKDVCVSYFHHSKLMGPIYGLEGSFDEYADLFLKGELGYGNYWNHLKV